jgi:hypothetical protein
LIYTRHIIRGGSHLKFRAVWLKQHIMAPARNIMVTSNSSCRKPEIEELLAVAADGRCGGEIAEVVLRCEGRVWQSAEPSVPRSHLAAGAVPVQRAADVARVEEKKAVRSLEAVASHGH